MAGPPSLPKAKRGRPKGSGGKGNQAGVKKSEAMMGQWEGDRKMKADSKAEHEAREVAQAAAEMMAAEAKATAKAAKAASKASAKAEAAAAAVKAATDEREAAVTALVEAAVARVIAAGDPVTRQTQYQNRREELITNIQAATDAAAAAAPGPVLRSRVATDATPQTYERKVPPRRVPGAVWTAAEILLTVTLVYMLKQKYPDTSYNVVQLTVAELTGLGITKLREVWCDWVRTGVLPWVNTYKRRPNPRRFSLISKMDITALRVWIRMQRHDEGKTVELPGIVEWFKTHRDKVLTRAYVYGAMKPMGFIWGATKRLCLHKESDRITARRHNYLRNRQDIDRRIKERDEDNERFKSSGQEGPHNRRMVYIYLDESYVHRNHSRGFSWFNLADDLLATVRGKSGKGERMVLLTGITEEFGMLNGNDTLLFFKAKQRTGDYHKNMDNDRFIDWMVDDLFLACASLGLEAWLVMDNASYHLNPAPSSVVPSAWTNKDEAYIFLDKCNIEHRKGRVPRGYNLNALKVIAHAWLKVNAKDKGIGYNISRAGLLCREHGHHILLTPPYHPELQPVEELWRDVKMYVGRVNCGSRSWTQLEEDVKVGFTKYGTSYHPARKVARAWAHEASYVTRGVYPPVIDLTTIPSTADLEFVDLTVDAQVEAQFAAIIVADVDEADEDDFDNGDTDVNDNGPDEDEY